jgi:hypothetical protein
MASAAHSRSALTEIGKGEGKVVLRARRSYLMAGGATDRKLPSADDADVADIMKKRSISSSDIRTNSQSFSGLYICVICAICGRLIIRNGEFRLSISLLHHSELAKIVRAQALRLCE